MQVNVADVMDSTKLSNDVTWMRKKIENLSSMISTITLPYEETSPKDSLFDITKFVYHQEFTEVCRGYIKDIFDTNRRIDELKRALEDLNVVSKSKASEKDLKNVESKN